MKTSETTPKTSETTPDEPAGHQALAPLQPVKQFFRGVCMGAADVVPGVSGGTVAFLLGIYPRLIHAVSALNLTCIRLLMQRQWHRANQQADLLFLVCLGGGIGIGILSTATTVHHLLSSDRWRAYTLAVFFGAIFASGILVARQSWKLHERWRFADFLAFGGALLVAAGLAIVPHQVLESPPAWYFFLGGAVAICAMLLPGISGALILLLLGLYGHLTGIPKSLAAREDIVASVTTLVVFGLGCATGLACFSRLLKWLLQQHVRPTMAALCGLMFGSLPKLWPYQVDLTPDIEKFEHKELRPTLPTIDHVRDLLPLVTILAVVLLVIAIHAWFERQRIRHPVDES